LGRLAAASDERIPIKMAGYDYDRVRGFIDGSVQVEGCEVSFEVSTIGGMNTDALGGPMTREVTEIGMVPYMLAYANDGLRSHTLIPVFPLRVFRHKSVFIRPDRGIDTPEDLRGKKIATPGYSSTSLTWIRGFMQHEYEVKPTDVHWVIAMKDSAGKDSGGASKQERVIPEGLEFSEGPPGMDESDLLVSGEVDALFHAAEPRAFIQGDPSCVRLFADSRQTEREYYAKTGIFPIMHAVAIRNDVVEQYPWLPEAVFEAYSKAKQQVYDYLRKAAWYKTTLPWVSQELEETRAVMGDNFYSYGLTPENRTTLEALFQYAYEQGLASRRLTIEELFHPSTMSLTE
jgi:4,5-dihydroxyphthalate decarboxylase